MSWRDKAACVGMASHIFFPTDQKFTESSWAAGRAVCAGCPVREECLALAISIDLSEDRWGMFGGMTPTERRYYRRSLPIRF